MIQKLAGPKVPLALFLSLRELKKRHPTAGFFEFHA